MKHFCTILCGVFTAVSVLVFIFSEYNSWSLCARYSTNDLLVSVLGVMITLLIGFDIYKTIDVNRKIKEIETKIDERFREYNKTIENKIGDSVIFMNMAGEFTACLSACKVYISNGNTEIAFQYLLGSFDCANKIAERYIDDWKNKLKSCLNELIDVAVMVIENINGQISIEELKVLENTVMNFNAIYERRSALLYEIRRVIESLQNEYPTE